MRAARLLGREQSLELGQPRPETIALFGDLDDGGLQRIARVGSGAVRSAPCLQNFLEAAGHARELVVQLAHARLQLSHRALALGRALLCELGGGPSLSRLLATVARGCGGGALHLRKLGRQLVPLRVRSIALGSERVSLRHGRLRGRLEFGLQGIVLSAELQKLGLDSRCVCVPALELGNSRPQLLSLGGGGSSLLRETSLLLGGPRFGRRQRILDVLELGGHAIALYPHRLRSGPRLAELGVRLVALRGGGGQSALSRAELGLEGIAARAQRVALDLELNRLALRDLLGVHRRRGHTVRRLRGQLLQNGHGQALQRALTVA